VYFVFSIQLMRRELPVLFVSFLLVTVSAAAHHSTAAYDMERIVEASGSVKDWYWGYPHTLLIVSVATRDAQAEEWTMEAGPPGVMTEAGWSKTSWKVGDVVSVKVHPRRREPKGGFLTEAKRANGEVLTVPKPPE
jgi:hypothetical protein